MNHHPIVWVFTLPALGREDPLEEGMATHSSIFGLEKSHEQKSLANYTLWVHRELDTTERLNTYTNCSTLENSEIKVCLRL